MVIELIVGLLLVVIVLYDVFETIVVPRRTDTKWRLSPPVIFVLWPLWQRAGLRLTNPYRRENFLGTFAPFLIVLMLVMWVLTLVLATAWCSMPCATNSSRRWTTGRAPSMWPEPRC